MPSRLARHLLPLLIIALAAACSKGVQWSPREKDNAAHIRMSLQAVSDAAEIANAATGSENDRERLLRALRKAHLHAARVDDAVLDKLHPELYGKFRLKYQSALAAMIRAHEAGDTGAAERAAADIRDFMNWYRNTTHTFRWWDEAAMR